MMPTDSDLLAEIAADIMGVEIQPGDLTASIVVAQVIASGSMCSRNTAIERLKKMVRAGRMVCVGETKGNREKVYRQIV